MNYSVRGNPKIEPAPGQVWSANMFGKGRYSFRITSLVEGYAFADLLSGDSVRRSRSLKVKLSTLRRGLKGHRIETLADGTAVERARRGLPVGLRAKDVTPKTAQREQAPRGQLHVNDRMLGAFAAYVANVPVPQIMKQFGVTEPNLKRWIQNVRQWKRDQKALEEIT